MPPKLYVCHCPLAATGIQRHTLQPTQCGLRVSDTTASRNATRPTTPSDTTNSQLCTTQGQHCIGSTSPSFSSLVALSDSLSLSLSLSLSFSLSCVSTRRPPPAGCPLVTLSFRRMNVSLPPHGAALALALAQLDLFLHHVDHRIVVLGQILQGTDVAE